MREEIKKLEKESLALEPARDEREKLLQYAVDYSNQFYNNLSDAPTYNPNYQLADEILDSSISEKPQPADSIVDEIKRKVDETGINTASGGHLGYIPGGGIFTSAVGDYLAAITNRYAGVHHASPGAVNIERRLIKWMADLVGYPQSAGGYLASGGSIANLTAVITAREAAGLKARDFEKAVIYQTDQTHHCIDRALRITGMGDAIQRLVSMDDRFPMKAESLSNIIKQDQKDGLMPWLIVGSAGTTDTGAVDPLENIAEIAQQFGIWFHVDAAYGGFFMLVDKMQTLFRGIEQSDSVVLDPHKGMFIPYGIGAVIVKDENLMADAYTYEANYMQDVLDQRTVLSPSDTSPELSKHFRGMRMWLPLKIHGIHPFRKSLEEKLQLAEYAYEQIKALDGFEVGPPPELSVFMFRYLPEDGDPDEFNKQLHQAVLNDGRIYLSSTKIDCKFMLRIAVLSVRTHLDTIDLAVNLINKKAKELAGQLSHEGD